MRTSEPAFTVPEVSALLDLPERKVRKEIEPQGFLFKELHDFLPWQHIIVFEKPAEDRRSGPEESTR